MALPELSLIGWAWIVIAVFIAGLVRGYSGFGYSALVVTSASLIVAPQLAVPVVMIHEIVASLGQAASIWRFVRWRVIGLLLFGAAIGTPLGVAALAALDADAARVAVGLIVLAAAVALLAGWRLRSEPGPLASGGVGIVSGVVNGVAAVGGLPVALLLVASNVGAAAARASVVAYLFAVDVIGLSALSWKGLVGAEALGLAAVTLPALGVGVALGSRRFLAASPEDFRRFATYLLALLALLTLARAAFI